LTFLPPFIRNQFTHIEQPNTMTSEPFQILVVGGGIAGLAAAIALRGPNREITVLEQSRLCSEIGATISLQPNATRILKNTCGLSDLLEAADGTVDCGFRIFNTEGKMVNEIPLLARTQYGADRIVWHRQDLHSYLMRSATSTTRTGPPVALRTSARVTSCDCDAGSVTLENSEILKADLVVGADGIHSKLRATVTKEEIKPRPTGSSCYRLMMSSEALRQSAPQFAAKIVPEDPYTSMIMAHDCRLIMGPARQGKLYSVVGLVPDERMNDDPDSAQSWVTEGDKDKMLETFREFPTWSRDMLSSAESIGLWQLRDIDPLKTWHRGRVILIGDAAHAMLPTQGQGASQAIEDAEALGALFAEVDGHLGNDEVNERLKAVFEARYERASLIQKFSREAARPATEAGSTAIKMRPDEFMDYNCMYRGAVKWREAKIASASA
jgi:salicylate hydroxylase